MADPIVRTTNTLMLLKIETTEGVDAAPTAADAFPFEEDGYSYNYPYKSEDSNENNGTLVAGPPLVIGQPADISIKVRLKGANAVYTSTVKPPHHVLLSIAGKRGLFTAAVAAAALTAGSTTSATLGTGFSSTAQAYLGMPLILTGVGAGAIPMITGYSAGKVATLCDTLGTALTTGTNAALPANWTYAGTSPRDNASRVTDHPSGTLYLYEDGTLHKFVGCRAVLDDLSADTAKPGFATFKLKGIYAGKTDATMPSTAVIPGHSAPTLVQGVGGISPAFTLNRLGLPISKFSLADASDLDSPDNPNTTYGFDAGQIGERTPMLSCDPLATLVATRDTLGLISSFAQFPGAIRFLGAVSNRMAITFPVIQPVEANPGLRAKMRSEEMKYRALDSGFDPQTRNTDMILCFH